MSIDIQTYALCNGFTKAYHENNTEETDLSAYAKTTEVNTAVNTAVADLIDGAPEALNTLKELADNFDGVATQEWVENKEYLTAHQDISNKTDRKVNGTNGVAYIFNETDGGGAKFENKDGTYSFVGVADEGASGIDVQIYAKNKDTNVGSRLDVKTTGMYYTVGSDGASARDVEANEIATKGWVNGKDYLTAHQDISGKLNILPVVDDQNDPGYGNPYWIPYNFEFTPQSDKVELTLHTLTLDNNFLKMDFNKDIPVATTSAAGFMSSADKTKLDGLSQYTITIDI